MKKRVAVTGLGAVTSFGVGVKALWENVRQGQSGISHISSFDTQGFGVRIAGEAKDFSAEEHLEARQARSLDRYSQFAVVAADEALKDCGLDLGRLDPRKVGVIVGTGIGGLLEIEAQHKRLLAKGPTKVNPFMIPKLMGNAASANISIKHGILGPSFSCASACASANHCLSIAADIISRGDADVMFAGGSEAAITPLSIAGFISMGALSKRNDEPEKASRPFDKDRDGFVMGEGAGVIILEDMEHAKKRGARIYGEVLGYGMSSDAYKIAAPDPDGRGAVEAMENGLRHCALNPEEIDYINAHGTGTPLGDISETNAIKKLFKKHARKMMVSSTKSMIGHLLGASGGVEFVVMALSVTEGLVTPTTNLDTPDPECDLDYVPNQSRQYPIRRAMSNSFGFGGHNVSIVIGKV